MIHACVAVDSTMALPPPEAELAKELWTEQNSPCERASRDWWGLL